MSGLLDARRQEVRSLLADLASWAATRPDVHAVALVGSYARGEARTDSDVDVVVLLTQPTAYPVTSDWFEELRAGSRLVRTARWGPVHEQRYQLRSGLLVEVGLAPPSWADIPLDPGTRRVLADGHQILHDPHGLLARAGAALAG